MQETTTNENGEGKAPVKGVAFLVEDDPLLSGVLSEKLEERNFKVLKAKDIPSARRTLAEHAGEVDIIAFDPVLSESDGFSFLQELKEDEHHKKIPVLLLSNVGEQEEIEKGMQLGAADAVTKADTTPDQIVEKLEELLRK